MRNIKIQHSSEFKVKVALEAIKQEKTTSQISNYYCIHPTQIKRWKEKVENGLLGVFTDDSGRVIKEKDELIDRLYHQIGKLQVQVDWLKKRWALLTHNLSPHQIVISHIKKEGNLSLSTQAKLLGISRSSVYYQPTPPKQEDFILMNQIDKIYTDMPYYGVVKMTKELKKQGFPVGRKRIRRLMRRMDLEAIYPRPKLSLNNQPHSMFPYLLKGLLIDYPN